MSSKRSLSWLWLLVAIQIAIPASYYLRDGDRDDERFAWRMFSGVRMKRCNVQVRRTFADRPAELLKLEGSLHSSWINTLKRGRRAVIARYLGEQCQGSSAAAELSRSCEGVKGASSSSETYHMDCATKQLSVRGP